MNSWIAAAAELPLAFAQVREDPLIDLAVVRAVGRPARIIMIGSGGCSSALLAADPQVASLHLVDPNPAQLALCRLKLDLLRETEPAQRKLLLGHAPMPPAQRERELAYRLDRLGLSPTALGPVELVTRLGPDQAGRYEALFQAIASELEPHAEALAELLQDTDPDVQSRRVGSDSALGQALHAVCQRQFDLSILVALFGAEATRNPAMSFAHHFHRQLIQVLATLPARGNHFLHQMLRASHPFEGGADWLHLPPRPDLPPVTFSNGLMADVLQAQPETYDVVHLSNILDWLSPEAAQTTLLAAYRALRRDGRVVLRQLNSTIDPVAMSTGIQWETAMAENLHAIDRSFFYRRLLIGRKA